MTGASRRQAVPTDKYRVQVHRLTPGSNETWVKEFTVSGPAGSVEEALTLASVHQRRKARVNVSEPAPDPDGPKFPLVHLTLNGHGDNPLAVLAMARQAMRTAGIPHRTIGEYSKECTHPNGALKPARSNDLAHVLATTRKWVTVE